MREIKFRAWDNDLKFMYELGLLEMPWPYKNIILMQFTGLKDRHEKEIYEGDIIEIPVGYSGHIPPVRNQITYIGGTYLLKPHGLRLGDWNKDGLIVGNIYESKHLLDKETANALQTDR